jgi:hypothetical protein
VALATIVRQSGLHRAGLFCGQGDRAVGPCCGRGPNPRSSTSEHLDGADGEAMFRHACAMGLEGIVSKRVDSRYKSGRCLSWVKIKNPAYVRRGRLSLIAIGPSL